MSPKRGKTLAGLIAKAPRDSRRTRHEEELFFSIGKCSLGSILVASSGDGVVAVSLGDDADQLLQDLELQFPTAHLVRSGREGKELLARVIAFIEKPARGFDFPVDMRGTAFQKRVWRAVQEIPAGQTSTYSEIAQKIGAPKAARAVGTACATCHLAFIVPCHRVLRKDGSLAIGVWREGRQQMLIDREATK